MSKESSISSRFERRGVLATEEMEWMTIFLKTKFHDVQLNVPLRHDALDQNDNNFVSVTLCRTHFKESIIKNHNE